MSAFFGLPLARATERDALPPAPEGRPKLPVLPDAAERALEHVEVRAEDGVSIVPLW